MILNFYKAKLSIFSIIAISIVCASCSHKKKPPVTWLYNDGQLEMINGRVKELSDLTLGEGKEFINWVYTFDKKGDLVTAEDIYNGGINTTKYTTVYDKVGKKVKSIGLDVDEDRRLGYVYEYDNNGNITSYRLFMRTDKAGRPSEDIYRFLYDESGNLIERQEYYSPKKKLGSIQKFKYLYNKTGDIIGIERAYTTKSTDFKVYAKDTIRYIVCDSDSNWLKAIRFGDTLTRKITYY